MFHNIIVKQNAAKCLNTMMCNIANPAKNGSAIKNAAMYANTTISMYAAMLTAQHLAPLTILAAAKVS